MLRQLLAGVLDPVIAVMAVRATVTVPGARVRMAVWGIVVTGEAALVIALHSRTAARAWVTRHSVPSARRWSMRSWR